MNDSPNAAPIERDPSIRSARQSFDAEYAAIVPVLHTWVTLRSRANPRLRGDVEDVVQEVWLRALEGHASFDPARGTFRAWVFGIVRLVFLESLRSSARDARGAAHNASTLLRERADSVTTICRRLERDESTRRFMELVETLDDEDRDLLAYCGLEGRTCGEAATLLGTSEAAATKRWQRLRERLRASGTSRGLVE